MMDDDNFSTVDLNKSLVVDGGGESSIPTLADNDNEDDTLKRSLSSFIYHPGSFSSSRVSASVIDLSSSTIASVDFSGVYTPTVVTTTDTIVDNDNDEKTIKTSSENQMNGPLESIKKWLSDVYTVSKALSPTTPPGSRKACHVRLFQSWMSSTHGDDSTAMSDIIIPIDVGVTFEFEDAVKRLTSFLLNTAETATGMVMKTSTDDHTAQAIIEKVAFLPHLMKTILLIEDKKDRNRIVSYPVIKMVLLCPYSAINQRRFWARTGHAMAPSSPSSCQNHDSFNVNQGGGLLSQSLSTSRHSHCRHRYAETSWLMELLHSEKTHVRRKVVDYFTLVSNISVHDYASIHRGHRPHRRTTIDSQNYPSGHSTPLDDDDDENDTPALVARPTHTEINRYLTAKRQLVSTLGSIHGLIPTMILLEDDDIGRASTTTLMRDLLDYHLTRGFGMFIIFMDLVCHVKLLLSWRLIVANEVALVATKTTKPVLMGGNRSDVVSSSLLFAPGSLWYSIVYSVGCLSLCYFLFRMVGEAVYTLSLSWEAFGRNYANFWNIVDTASILMVMMGYVISLRKVTSVGNDDPRGLEWLSEGYFTFTAISIGLLWLKFVGFLKMVNWKLATFTQAVVQIVKDVSLFILIISVVIIAFGDMLNVILSTNNEICPNSPINDNISLSFSTNHLIKNIFRNVTMRHDSTYRKTSLFQKIDNVARTVVTPSPQPASSPFDNIRSQEDNPFCQNQPEGYLAVYRLFIGDFSMEHFNQSTLATVLFVLLTFFGIIIMLNILIALVNESYEKSLLGADRLFGRARLTYVAKILALEYLIRPMTGTRRRGHGESDIIRMSCNEEEETQSGSSRPSDTSSSSSRSAGTRWMHSVMRLFSLSIIICDLFFTLVIIGSICEEIVVVYDVRPLVMLIVGLIVALLAAYIWFVMVSFLITGWEHDVMKEIDNDGDDEVIDNGTIRWQQQLFLLETHQNGPIFRYLVAYPVMFITRSLVGVTAEDDKMKQVYPLHCRGDHTIDDYDETQEGMANGEEWHGRLRYLEGVIDRKMTSSVSILKNVVKRNETKRFRDGEKLQKTLTDITMKLNNDKDGRCCGYSSYCRCNGDNVIIGRNGQGKCIADMV